MPIQEFPASYGTFTWGPPRSCQLEMDTRGQKGLSNLEMCKIWGPYDHINHRFKALKVERFSHFLHGQSKGRQNMDGCQTESSTTYCVKADRPAE